MAREAILVIADILTEELALPTGQIMLAYERYDIPATNGLYIALNYVGGKSIGNNNYSIDDGQGGMTEVQEVTMLYDIQIDAMSFDESARARKEEIFQALASIYAEQQMSANTMQIARMPQGFANATSLEETKMLNRFTTGVRVTQLVTKTKAAPYYNQFPNPEVTVNV